MDQGARGSGAGSRAVVESVLRASRLLDCFQRGRPEMTLPEFVRAAGYSKTTTYRLLVTLEVAGWLERTPAGAFRLTTKPFQLGTILVDSLDLRREAVPVMTELAARCHDTVYLTVVRDGYAVCLERIDAGRAFRLMHLDVGGSQALYLGAGPRALLAYREDELLPGVLAAGLRGVTDATIVDPHALRVDLAVSRERGYTVSLGDATVGVGAVGAPVLDATGTAVAAMSIGGLVARYVPPGGDELAGHLVDACARVSYRLGYRRQPPPP